MHGLSAAPGGPGRLLCGDLGAASGAERVSLAASGTKGSEHRVSLEVSGLPHNHRSGAQEEEEATQSNGHREDKRQKRPPASPLPM